LKATAPAKINLFLHVLGRREDGYHEIESLISFTDFGDEIEVAEAETLSLSINGDYTSALSDDIENNLIIKAARLLQAHTDIRRGASISLKKQLPIASGIGGGSSDAATALRLLSELWKLSITTEELQKLTVPLGADLPACVTRKTVYASGLGEKLEAGPNLSGIPILLVNPNIPFATAPVFSALTAPYTKSNVTRIRGKMHLEELTDYLRPLRNDLEPAAISLLPEIAVVRDSINSLPGCKLARMSGSGATCFGLFETSGDVIDAAARILSDTGWWCKSGNLL